MTKSTGARAIAAYMTSDRNGSLDLAGCTGLTSLPDGLTVGGSLSLAGCTGLTALPGDLTVGGSLSLDGCTGLTALPGDLTVGGSLSLAGCTGLTALPGDLTVGGSLYLTGCTGLTALPDGLTVGGGPYPTGCTGLTALPGDLTVGGGLYLTGCTGLAHLSAGKDGRGYEWFGVRVQDGLRIIAGCRNFTPDGARAHWTDRPEQLALAERAIAIAEARRMTDPTEIFNEVMAAAAPQPALVSLRAVANETSQLGVLLRMYGALLFLRDDGQDATPEELAALDGVRKAIAKLEALT